jgi:hypothetical protein
MTIWFFFKVLTHHWPRVTEKVMKNFTQDRLYASRDLNWIQSKCYSNLKFQSACIMTASLMKVNSWGNYWKVKCVKYTSHSLCVCHNCSIKSGDR